MAADVIPMHGRGPVRLSQDDNAVRTHALAAVECVWCEAQPGEPCTRTDALGVQHQTRLLHQCRMTTARKELETPA